MTTVLVPGQGSFDIADDETWEFTPTIGGRWEWHKLAMPEDEFGELDDGEPEAEYDDPDAWEDFSDE
jgi:hypothetical protein